MDMRLSLIGARAWISLECACLGESVAGPGPGTGRHAWHLRVPAVPGAGGRASAGVRPPRRGRPAADRATLPRGAGHAPGGDGIASTHTALHLRDPQVLVELDGDQGAVGLLHMRLVHAVTGVRLDSVDGATGNRL